MTRHLDDVLDFANNLPSLPIVVVEAIKLLSDETVDNDRIASVLSRDQMLVAQLLKLSNSAYYGVSRRVSTVRQAMLVLGRKAARSLVIAAGSHDILSRPQPGYLLERDHLWMHSLATGRAAALVAHRVGYRPPDEAFVAGLLHDIGKVVLSSFLAERAGEVAEQLDTLDQSPFTAIEQDLLQIDHAELGAILAEHWQLPAHLSHAIQYHHRPGEAGEDWQLPTVVHVANALTLSLGVGLGVDGLATVFDEAAVTRLGLGSADLEALADELVEQLYEPEVS